MFLLHFSCNGISFVVFFLRVRHLSMYFPFRSKGRPAVNIHGHFDCALNSYLLQIFNYSTNFKLMLQLQYLGFSKLIKIKNKISMACFKLLWWTLSFFYQMNLNNAILQFPVYKHFPYLQSLTKYTQCIPFLFHTPMAWKNILKISIISKSRKQFTRRDLLFNGLDNIEKFCFSS